MGSERASVMMRMLPPVGWGDVATRRDLEELELRIDAKLERFRSEILRTFGTWLFASQAAVIAAVTLVVALVR
jgi:hypothetical protein